jgi:hypothetical protein
VQLNELTVGGICMQFDLVYVVFLLRQGPA